MFQNILFFNTLHMVQCFSSLQFIAHCSFIRLELKNFTYPVLEGLFFVLIPRVLIVMLFGGKGNSQAVVLKYLKS